MFEKIDTKKLKYKTSELPDIPQGDYILPALTAGIQNQGLNNYVPYDGATVLNNVISISANGANTGATFYQSKEFTVLQDAYAIKWVFNGDVPTDAQYLFLAGAVSKTIYGNYEWTNKAGWERIKNDVIQLPTRNGAIDFDFMETFIAELEAQRIAELEAYLTAAGLKDCTLTAQEEEALRMFEAVEWGEYSITEVFDIKNTKSILSSDIVANSGNIPYLCASADNNSVSSYISYKEQMLDKGNCVFIGGKTFVVSYQEFDFFSNDSHNLALYVIDKTKKDKISQLFLVTCVKKSLGHKYTWGDSISKQKINTDNITLPQNFSKTFMQTFISAIQKLVIRDVAAYSDRKMTAARQAAAQ